MFKLESAESKEQKKNKTNNNSQYTNIILSLTKYQTSLKMWTNPTLHDGGFNSRLDSIRWILKWNHFDQKTLEE